MNTAKPWLAPLATSCALHALPLVGFFFLLLPSPVVPTPLFLQLSAPINNSFSAPSSSIKRFTTKGQSSIAASSASSSASSPNIAILEATYADQIRQELEQRKYYPTQARSLGQSGRVLLQFAVNQDGTISHFALAEKSPFPSLNQAALDLLRSVKLPPIPQELQRMSWQFTFPLEYRLD